MKLAFKQNLEKLKVIPMRVSMDLAGEQGHEQPEMHRSQENIIIILSGDQDGGVIRYRGLCGEEQTLRSLER